MHSHHTSVLPYVVKHTGPPLPMHYLGSKTRISEWILQKLESSFPAADKLYDVMAGTGAISHAALQRGYQIHVNDIQPYSYYLNKSAFQVGRQGIQEIIDQLTANDEEQWMYCSGRSRFRSTVDAESRILPQAKSKDNWEEYYNFTEANLGNIATCTGDWDLFSSYYLNTYFGVRQCLEIDGLRELAEKSNENTRIHLIGALISSLTYAASTTTHLAQYLKPSSQMRAEKLANRRSLSITQMVLDRLKRLLAYHHRHDSTVTNNDAVEIIKKIKSDRGNTVVYADPPYFKEHYSRYYHVLDTLVLYDYPDITWNNRISEHTVGRYRADRIQSKFGLKSKVFEAFGELMATTRNSGAHLALSYASTSLVTREELIGLAESNGFEVGVESIELQHSSQGQSNRTRKVTEYLFLLKNKDL